MILKMKYGFSTANMNRWTSLTRGYGRWISTICVFLVKGNPLYRLDYLPTKEVLNGNDKDEKLSKHAYVHKIIPRPSVEDPATLQNYSLFCSGTALLHAILGIKETLANGNTPSNSWLGAPDFPTVDGR
ncbi:hypothetical protein L218DRAFT_457897 [Marasmius fiardii PR-910]|nr:hypothetical protein L218DRAFT_457897 [Marasmius fiardii PR-910]